MLPTDTEIAEGRTTTRRRTCNRACGVGLRCGAPVPCTHCNAPTKHRKARDGNTFCNNDCYQAWWSRKPLACGSCLEEFLPTTKTQRYCSTKCMGVANRGKGNPNYGKRHPGMWSPRAEHRHMLSEARMGPGNPNWSGGSKGNGHYRFQAAISRWCLSRMPKCTCGADTTDVQHIVPRKAFRDVRMSHFAENLIGLCMQCHKDADNPLLRGERGYDLRHTDRLPQPILDQWRTDGCVSLLPEGLDWSPLGTVARLALDPRWFATGKLPDELAPCG